MGTAQRYVVNEVLKVFAVTLGVSLFFATFGGGLKDGLKQGLPPSVVLWSLPYVLPEILRFTIPGCLLFAVCSVFSRMSAANEILALKSAGVNPWRVAAPVLVLGYLLSVATFGLYELCACWSRPNLKRLVVESSAEVAYGLIRTNGSFRSKGLFITARGVEGGDLLCPTIELNSKGKDEPLILTARSVRLSVDKLRSKLRIVCRDGVAEMGEVARLALPGIYVHEVDLPGAAGPDVDRASPAALRTSDLSRQIALERQRVTELEAGCGSVTGGEQQDRLAGQLRRSRERLYRLKAETPRRLANGFSCLGFVLIGIPIAVWRRSGDNMSVFFVCFTPILLVYYPLLVLGETWARDGLIPQLSVWLADVVLFVAGAALLIRMVRR